MSDRVRDWADRAIASFADDAVHEENLSYLLGESFDFGRAWEQTLAAFDRLTQLVAERHHEAVVVRAVVPLNDAERLVAAVPQLDALLADLSTVTPPMLVLIPPRLALDHRRFEEYRVGLATDIDAAVTYCAARSLDHPSDDIWTRSLWLDRF